MTIYYLSSVDGDNASDGLSWANAFATFKYAVETASAAASGPHVVYVDSAHSETVGADTTTTLAADLRVLSVNRAGGDVPLAGAIVNAQATNYSYIIAGAFNFYCFGVTFKTGTATSAAKNLNCGNTDGGHYEWDACSFTVNGNTGSVLTFGTAATANGSCFNKLMGCTITYGHAGNTTRFRYTVEMIGSTVAGTAPTTWLSMNTPCDITIEGCDLSVVTGTLIGNMGNSGHALVTFLNCRLGTGVTMMATPGTVVNRGQTAVWAYNCNAGDVHYSFFHGDPFGSTTAQATIYATAGAQTNSVGVAYAVVTTANCSYFTPYVGPWIAKAHTGASAITPSFEVVRSGSASAYNDWDMWGQWSYQGTTGYPKAVYVDDRGTAANLIAATASAQATGALAAGDWTGENATAWFGTFAPASTITPAEVGFLYGRVIVGKASVSDLYYDPQIRVA